MKICVIFVVTLSLMLNFNCQPNTESEAEIVPQWAKQAIWYQIFPERFRNGDTNNDPTVQEIADAWPYAQPKNWQPHPWTSDWFDLQPWEEVTGEGFYWNSTLRRYGGDLQGVMDKLDYLQELGVNAIYFNPLFESPSHHKYDATQYRHIDNNFGPNPEKDRQIWEDEDPIDPGTWKWTTADSLFLELIDAIHQRDMKIIIDGVFNHVGYTFWAFQDLLENQQESPYKDWFIVKSWDNPQTPENEFDYAGWAGVKDLPEFREDEKGLVDGPRQHVKAIVQRWMDPNGDGDPSDGIDGWRLDVAEKVSLQFWSDFRSWVKAINPDAFLTGEVWWEEWEENKIHNAAPWLNGIAFDAVMNYRWARAVKKFIIDQKTQIPVQAFVDSINTIYQDYPTENTYVMQNLMDSHDVDRVASQIVNPDRWYDHEANPKQNSEYKVRKPEYYEQLKQKLIVGLQMTMPGAPMIYYGDEAGMWGGDDPDCRKPMVWPELEYESEDSHPLGKDRPADEVYFDQNLFDWYKKLISLRKANDALSLGDIEFFLIENSKNILGFRRTYQDKKYHVLINNSNKVKVIDFVLDTNLKENTTVEDLVSGQRFGLMDQDLKISLNPYQIVILK